MSASEYVSKIVQKYLRWADYGHHLTDFSWTVFALPTGHGRRSWGGTPSAYLSFATLILRMSVHVALELVLSTEGAWAHLARVRPFPGVSTHVPLQMRRASERSRAVVTLGAECANIRSQERQTESKT